MRKTQSADSITQEPVQTAGEQHIPMTVDVKISSIRSEGNVKAYASINLNDCFAIRNVKVVDSSKGLFIAMPNYKTGNGEYKDICFPVTKEFREQLNNAVIDAYNQALTQSHKQKVQDAPSSGQVPEQSSCLQMG